MGSPQAASRARARDERVACGRRRESAGEGVANRRPDTVRSCSSRVSPSRIRIESAGEGVANRRPDTVRSCSSRVSPSRIRIESAGEGVDNRRPCVTENRGERLALQRGTDVKTLCRPHNHRHSHSKLRGITRRLRLSRADTPRDRHQSLARPSPRRRTRQRARMPTRRRGRARSQPTAG